MKPFIFFISVLFFSLTLQAQEGFFIGSQVQTGGFWLYNQEDVEYMRELGLQSLNPTRANSLMGGLQFGYYANSRLGMESGVQFSSQALKRSQMPEETSNIYTETRLRYVHVPLQLKYSFNQGITSSLYIAVGVDVSFLTYYHDGLSLTPSDPSGVSTSILATQGYSYYFQGQGAGSGFGAPIESHFNKVQVAARLSAGWRWPLGQHWAIDLGVAGMYGLIRAERDLARYPYSIDGQVSWIDAEYIGSRPLRWSSSSKWVLNDISQLPQSASLRTIDHITRNIWVGVNLGLQYFF